MNTASALAAFARLGTLPLVGTAGLAGCGATPDTGAPAAGAAPLLAPQRVLGGGFLSAPGLSPLPGSGMFTKWLAPSALALRGTDLLVLDAGQGRLWRVDTLLGTLAGVAGAPTGAHVALALGVDGSAWVLDATVGQLLRFARDGRLLSSLRLDGAVGAVGAGGTASFVLVDAGATLLLALPGGTGWIERRTIGAAALDVLPRHADGRRIGVDALAVNERARDRVWALDGRAGEVHEVQRDGLVRASLGGAGMLRQPVALAVDAWERAWVVDAQAAALVVLARNAPARRFALRELGVAQFAALAIDGRLLAIADRLRGQVQLFALGAPRAEDALT